MIPHELQTRQSEDYSVVEANKVSMIDIQECSAELNQSVEPADHVQAPENPFKVVQSVD